MDDMADLKKAKKMNKFCSCLPMSMRWKLFKCFRKIRKTCCCCCK